MCILFLIGTLRSNGRIVDEPINIISQRKRGRKMKVVSLTDDDEINQEDCSMVEHNVDEKINMVSVMII